MAIEMLTPNRHEQPTITITSTIDSDAVKLLFQQLGPGFTKQCQDLMQVHFNHETACMKRCTT
jgi:hypothetical protein